MSKKNKKRVVRNLKPDEVKFVGGILSESPVLSDADISHMLKEEGLASDLSMKDLRNKVRYLRKKIVNEPAERVRVQTTKSGDVIVHRSETGMKTDNREKYLDETLVESIGLDPSEFQLSSYGESEWDSASGDTLHSTRKKFSRIPDKAISAMQMEEKYFRDKLFGLTGENNTDTVNAPAIVAEAYKNFCGDIKVNKDSTGKYSLIIPLADLHIGEAPADKMVKSYKKTFENVIFPYIKEMYFQNGSEKVRTLDFVTLGDIIHCDNAAGTTTAGTVLQPKTDAYKSFNYGVEFLNWLIATALKAFEIPVRMIYVYGNHDMNMGFGVLSTVKAHWDRVPSVSFILNEKLFSATDEDNDWYMDYEENPEYQWVAYGRVGVTYCHGKFGKKNANQVPDVANLNARKDVDFNVVIYGHLHHLNEGGIGVNQHNYGLSTPNFCRDKFAKNLACVSDPEFYLFTINHNTNRPSYVSFPSLPYDSPRWDKKH